VISPCNTNVALSLLLWHTSASLFASRSQQLSAWLDAVFSALRWCATA
jgi:hypothetical protein